MSRRARQSWSVLDHPGTLAFAHRGGAGDWPENTMPAFEAAVALGYSYIETDVHLTADGVLVAFHDEALDRVSDRTGRIADLSWAEVKRAQVSPPPGSSSAPAPIPRLEDLLGAWPALRVNIDPKHDGSVDALVEVLERTGAQDRVCVAAFSDRRLMRIRRLTNGRVCTALGPVAIARLRAASFGLPCREFTAGCAQVPRQVGGRPLVDARFVQTARRLGLQVHVWTVDEASEMDELLDLGVDGIMTDRPTVLKDVLERRGLWV